MIAAARIGFVLFLSLVGSMASAALLALILLSLALAPIFLVVTRRVGALRRELSTSTQRSLADLTAIRS